MASVLTEHVRNFGTSVDDAEAVLPALENFLRSRMRQRGLLHSSPALLGYPGVPNWQSPGAFEDIVADCYVFAMAERIVALQNQLIVKPNVDGLIARNVQNFLTERQRAQDPVGYSVFGNVLGAVKDGVAAGTVLAEGTANQRISRDTVLRFPRTAMPEPETIGVIEAALDKLGVSSDAVASLVKNSEDGREWVAELIQFLNAERVAAFRLGDVVFALASVVRSEWIARHAETPSGIAREGDDDFSQAVRLIWPEFRLDVEEQWTKLKAEVPQRIAALDRQERVRERVQRLFAALVMIVEEGGREPPSQADLIERTGIARATISDDFRMLRGILEEMSGRNPEA